MGHHNEHPASDTHHVPARGTVTMAPAAPDRRATIQIQPFVGYQLNTRNISIVPPFRVLVPNVSITGSPSDGFTVGFNGVWLQHAEGPSLVAGIFMSGNAQRGGFDASYGGGLSYGALFGGNDLLTRGVFHLASPQVFAQCVLAAGSNPMCGVGAQYTIGVDLIPNRLTVVAGGQGQAMYDFIARTILVGFTALIQVQGAIPITWF
jgi:hypothetical protein